MKEAALLNPCQLRPPENDKIKVKIEAPSGQEERDVLLAYWSVQQDRMQAHESSRYNFTNFMVAGSLAVLGIVGTGTMNLTGRWIICIAVILANLVACSFTLSELRWFKIHQYRARAVLHALKPSVDAMEVLADSRWCTTRADDLNGGKKTFTSTMALLIIHWAIALSALLLGFVGSIS